MKCSEVRTFLSQVYDRVEPITPVPSADLEYWSINGYVQKTTKEDYEKGASDVARLSQIYTQIATERSREQQTQEALQQDVRKEHSFLFHLEGTAAKDQLGERIQQETAAVSSEASELNQLEAIVNDLIQKKSVIDRMVVYDGGYLSLTGLGALVFNDLSVRSYRVGVDAEAEARSLLWSTGIGLAKLQGNTMQIGDRFTEALGVLRKFNSTLPSKLMAAEIMTAVNTPQVQSLESILRNLDQQIRKQGVPKEQSAGVAATIMAGRRFDGTYPIDRFAQFEHLTKSSEAASILAVMNVPIDGLSSRFQQFRSLFTSWGYMISEDTEIASAFLGIGELDADEVGEKLKYVLEQLHNYLQYPIVAAAILASIPVFEAHETLDLMEKAVTLLTGYATGLERSHLVALAVRMIHGVRNEIVKEIDPTAKITDTPVQFTYGPHPGFFVRYYPVIIAHSSYHATFSGMGGFHPAHSHGVGGFAG